MADREKFQIYVNSALENMKSEYIDLTSGAVHRATGGYPGTNHRMPVCCDVMYAAMRGDDKVLSAPPKGKGASLSIRYFKRNH